MYGEDEGSVSVCSSHKAILCLQKTWNIEYESNGVFYGAFFVTFNTQKIPHCEFCFCIPWKKGNRTALEHTTRAHDRISIFEWSVTLIPKKIPLLFCWYSVVIKQKPKAKHYWANSCSRFHVWVQSDLQNRNKHEHFLQEAFTLTFSHISWLSYIKKLCLVP